jgi:CRISPR type III-B/RAMP module-associated protein Cmr5
MKNLDQIRAKNAIQYSSESFPGADGGEVVKKVPTLIRENGILAALAFALEKKSGNQLKNPGHNKVFECIVNHLKHASINKIPDSVTNPELFSRYLVDKDAAVLRDATEETMAYMNYLRRFAKK